MINYAKVVLFLVYTMAGISMKPVTKGEINHVSKNPEFL